jgi:DNA-binding transcriptional regulator GbsR (MarR family)
VALATSPASRNGLGPHLAAGGEAAVFAEIEQELVEHFVELASIVGLPRSYGEIYGLLYASRRPLSFADIHERLALSKGSVSQGLRALREIGAVRPIETGDDRREHFVAETELRRLLAGFVSRGLRPRLKTGIERIERLRLRHRNAGKSEDARLLGMRLDKLQSWHRKGGMLLPIITKFLG